MIEELKCVIWVHARKFQINESAFQEQVNENNTETSIDRITASECLVQPVSDQFLSENPTENIILDEPESKIERATELTKFITQEEYAKQAITYTNEQVQALKEYIKNNYYEVCSKKLYKDTRKK